MKILALADEPCEALWSVDAKSRLMGIDLILSSGDLPREYLEYLTNFTTAPILYVHGNHDDKYAGEEPGGCQCIDGQVYTWHGLRIVGLGGSIRYSPTGRYQYSEPEMQRRIRRLRWKLHRTGGFDLLLTHSPARGLNDQNDAAHRGFECFNLLLDQYAPRWFVHGHVHLRYDCKLPRTCMRASTMVINACERYVFEIPDEALTSPQ